jgi:hypothetical protein
MLHDSPVGLAAWILEKWRAWTDPAGDLERHFSRDLLLTNVTLYWVTGTANAANRSYYERARDPRRSLHLGGGASPPGGGSPHFLPSVPSGTRSNYNGCRR